jgi:hypothetical protein
MSFCEYNISAQLSQSAENQVWRGFQGVDAEGGEGQSGLVKGETVGRSE